MGWDQAGYYLAPFFGQIGRGISDAIMGSRTSDALRGITGAKNLDDFAKLQTPDNIYDPESVLALEKLKAAKKTELQGLDAAPKLAKFANDYQDITGTANPRFFADPESRAELAKAGLKSPDATNNPLVSTGLNQFLGDANNAETMANVLSGSDPQNIGTQLSQIALQEKLPGQLHSVAGVQKSIADGQQAVEKIKGERGNLEASRNLDYIYRNKTPLDQFVALGDLAGVTGASPEWVGKQADDLRQTNNADQRDQALDKRLEASDRRQDKSIAAADARAARAERRAEKKGDNYDRRQTDKEFQNDLSYLRGLDKAVATGGKGLIMIDGVPTSFDGSADSLALLKQMQADQENTMRKVYPDKMAKRRPQAAAKPPPRKQPAAPGVPAGTSWKSVPKK